LQVAVAWAGLGVSKTASVTVILQPLDIRVLGAAAPASVQLWRARAGEWTDVGPMTTEPVRVGSAGVAVGGTQLNARLRAATPLAPNDEWTIDALAVELEYERPSPNSSTGRGH